VALDLGRFQIFEQLKASQASFAQLHAEQPFTVAGGGADSDNTQARSSAEAQP
jgi:hypothetical protein